MSSYKLVTFRAGAAASRVGLLVNGKVHDLVEELAGRAATGIDATGMTALLSGWAVARDQLPQIAADLHTAGIDLADVQLLAPLDRPGAIYCAGANYYDHVKEMGNKVVVKEEVEPLFFVKSNTTIIGTRDEIRLPQGYSQKFDWEIEVAAVIGLAARNVSVEDALSHVAGYTILNDLSARDRGWRKDWPFGMDWNRHKSFDTSGPMGPSITPASEIADVQNLALKTTISGDLMQDSSTAQMIFTVAELISSLSRQITLRPGDVVSTGTCAGVGNARGRFLVPGDTIEMEVEGLGVIYNTVAAEAGDSGHD